jgi:hypothetical protein
MGIPVVIAHFGRHNYLQFCLQSAARFNTDVVFIGDESNKSLWPSCWNSGQADTQKFRQFMDSYVKLSDYADPYEMGLWKRPFMIEAWMKEEGVEKLFIIDSDVMSFADYSKEVAPQLPADCGATIMVTAAEQEIGDWWSSFHFSYWTREALQDFTSFIVAAYRDPNLRGKLEAKYRWHIDNGRPGGICDITLLYFWAKEHAGKVLNLAKVTNQCVADLGVNTSTNYFDQEYEMRGGFKRLVFRNGIPFGFNKVLRQEVRFWCLHCQGQAKGVMPFLGRRGLRAFFPELYRAKGASRLVRGLPWSFSELLRAKQPVDAGK